MLTILSAHNHFVTYMAKTRAFAIISPCTLEPTPSLPYTPYYMASQVPLFIRSIPLSSLWVSCTGSASDWCALQEVLYQISHLLIQNKKQTLITYTDTVEQSLFHK